MKNILKRTILNTLASSLVALLLLGTACTTDYSSNNPFDPGNAGKLASAYDLSATIVVNEIRLTWDNPTTASAVGEWVILRTDLTDNSEEIVLIAQEAANLSYNDNALTQTDASLRIVAGHDYEYRVAISSDGFALGGTESGTAGGVAITDLDEDGFWDDGDTSGTIGDNLCAAGATASADCTGEGCCDDNCPSVANPSQNALACVDADGDCVLDFGQVETEGGSEPCTSEQSGPAKVGDICPLSDAPACMDNCVGQPNGDQINSDDDVMGDDCDADDDNDGLLDTEDNCRTVANVDQLNRDYDSYGDPCDPDLDGDNFCNAGVTEVVEGQCDSLNDNCKWYYNPLQGNECDDDSDVDGISTTAGGGEPGQFPCQGGNTDGCDDNCPVDSNSTQLDDNNNAIGDICETDSDNDDVPDFVDNCPSNYNPGQEDLDKDREGDVCDNDDDGDGTMDGSDPCSLDADDDSDGDGVCVNPYAICGSDGAPTRIWEASASCSATSCCGDNCVGTPNADQTDLDGNGVGALCDTDDDGDGILSTGAASCTDGNVTACDDNCPAHVNPLQEDLDADGVGALCDNDDDGDGIVSDTDENGIFSETPCTGGATTDCDDNCPSIPNSNQADDDNDGIGNLCDSVILIQPTEAGDIPFPTLYAANQTVVIELKSSTDRIIMAPEDATLVLEGDFTLTRGILTTDPVTLVDGVEVGGKIDITAHNITLEYNAEINVTGLGYPGGKDPERNPDSLNGATLGFETLDGAFGGSVADTPIASDVSGGSYGGRGGLNDCGSDETCLSYTYGDYRRPAHYGSGGGASADEDGVINPGGNGGGIINLKVNGDLVVQGDILADGATANNYSGSGSGGSIQIEMGDGEISGYAEIKAMGGANDTAAGGGGRIAVIGLTQGLLGGTDRYQCITGTKYLGCSSSYPDFRADGGRISDRSSGGSGTIYFENTNGTGELLLSNYDTIHNSYVPRRDASSRHYAVPTSTISAISEDSGANTTTLTLDDVWLPVIGAHGTPESFDDDDLTCSFVSSASNSPCTEEVVVSMSSPATLYRIHAAVNAKPNSISGDIGDVTLWLKSPSGTSMKLWDGRWDISDSATLGNEIDVVFGDNIWTHDSLHDVRGEDPDGVWELTVQNDNAGVALELLSFSLNVYPLVEDGSEIGILTGSDVNLDISAATPVLTKVLGNTHNTITVEGTGLATAVGNKARGHIELGNIWMAASSFYSESDLVLTQGQTDPIASTTTTDYMIVKGSIQVDSIDFSDIRDIWLYRGAGSSGWKISAADWKNTNSHFNIENTLTVPGATAADESRGILELLNVKSMTLIDNAALDVSGKGYRGGLSGDNTNERGLTAGNALGALADTGGSHAGFGGRKDGFFEERTATYGSIIAPMLPGGGSGVYDYNGTIYRGGNGGGAVHLSFEGGLGSTLAIDEGADILADGENPTIWNSPIPGGAGGSIFINMNGGVISSTGLGTCKQYCTSIWARGGAGEGNIATSHSGGGGRISIVGYANTDQANFDSLDFRVGGGGLVYYTDHERGTPGTIYLQESGNATGSLILSNWNGYDYYHSYATLVDLNGMSFDHVEIGGVIHLEPNGLEPALVAESLTIRDGPASKENQLSVPGATMADPDRGNLILDITGAVLLNNSGLITVEAAGLPGAHNSRHHDQSSNFGVIWDPTSQTVKENTVISGGSFGGIGMTSAGTAGPLSYGNLAYFDRPGSGGGAYDDGDGTADIGGNGGGLIIIRAGSLDLNGDDAEINANGGELRFNDNSSDCGAGGSGGGILIDLRSGSGGLNGTGEINAKGGTAAHYSTSDAYNTCTNQWGMGGGGGRIAIIGINNALSLDSFNLKLSAEALSTESTNAEYQKIYAGSPGTVFMANASGLGRLTVDNGIQMMPDTTTPLPAFSSGDVTSSTSTTLTDASAPYEVDELVGMGLAPDSGALSTCYPITENTESVMSVATADLSTTGANYDIVYKLDEIHVGCAQIGTTEHLFVDDTANSSCTDTGYHSSCTAYSSVSAASGSTAITCN